MSSQIIWCLILVLVENKTVLSLDTSFVVPVYVKTPKCSGSQCFNEIGVGTVIQPKLILTANQCLLKAKANVGENSQEINLFIYSRRFHNVHRTNQFVLNNCVALKLETALDVYIPKPYVVRTFERAKIYEKLVTYGKRGIRVTAISIIQIDLWPNNSTSSVSAATGSGVFVDCPTGTCLAGVIINEPGQTIEFSIDTCSMDYYDKDTMKIYKNNDKNLQILSAGKGITPTINDSFVTINCINGHYLILGSIVSCSIDLTCSGTKWLELEDDQPQCIKLCSARELNQLYAMEPKCTFDGISVNCRENAINLPGTIANFSCAIGFLNNERQSSVICLKNGSWDGLQELYTTQEKYCSQDCQKTYSHTLIPTKANIQLGTARASSTVAIFMKLNRTLGKVLTNIIHKCSGVMIRLDLVLTAAHCLIMDDKQIEENMLLIGYLQVNTNNISNKDQLREVYRYWLHPEFDKFNLSNDIAILQMKHRVENHMGQGIICLPWTNINRTISNSTEGNVNAWSSDTRQLQLMPFIVTEITNHSDNFNISLAVGFKLCNGDSGSPLVVNCNESYGSAMCLIGIVSKAKGAAEHITNCTPYIVATNLFYESTMKFIQSHFMDFIGRI